MSVIPLTASAGLGIRVLDHDHKELITLFNLLVGADADADGELATVLAQSLKRQIREHFRREEYIIEQYDYPDRDEHRSLHADALILADKLERHCLAGQPVADLLAIFRTMLVNQLFPADRKLASYFRDLGVSVSVRP